MELDSSNRKSRSLRRLADYLPHTPVDSFGINFIFSGEIDQSVLALLKLGDNIKFEELGASIKTTKISRQIEISKRVSNLAISFDDLKMTFDFNFHFKISSLFEFKEKLEENKILSLKNIAVDIIQNSYGLQLPDAKGA